MTYLSLRLQAYASLGAVALLVAGISAAQQAPPAATGATPPAAEAAPPGDASAESPPADDAAPPQVSPAKPAAAKGSPQRFEPTEKVRPDFDVAFPVDI